MSATRTLLGLAAILTLAATQARAYDPTYGIAIPGTLGTPAITMPVDPNDPDAGYDAAYYNPQSTGTAPDNQAGTVHVSLGAHGRRIVNGLFVMAWLTGDVDQLVDSISTPYAGSPAYHPITAEADLATWDGLQAVYGIGTLGHFTKAWRFDGEIPAETSFDYSWDVGADVSVTQLAFVPEPASLALLALGAVAALTRRPRR